eukprot:Skav220434  [mRNA]  locus=scaffold639:908999:921074:+ [translate_table: standard]
MRVWEFVSPGHDFLKWPLTIEVFQLVPMGETKKEDRLGLHAFPTRAHRLQRWFGVRHFLVISHLVALGEVSLRRRFPWDLGPTAHKGVSTDLHFAVQSSLEHLAGLADFFRRKAEITNAEPWLTRDHGEPRGTRAVEPCRGVLLGFRREAKQIRSAEQSMQSQVPKTAMASLQAAIQESLESILLPTAGARSVALGWRVGEMLQMTDACMALPVVPAGAVSTALLGWTGARRQGRLTKLAELSSKMRCFKGAE